MTKDTTLSLNISTQVTYIGVIPVKLLQWEILDTTVYLFVRILC